MMVQFYQNPEAFAAEFMKDHRAREEAIDRLIAGSNRLLLNIPRYGPARRISRLLRQGPFSGFYDFENGLARRLHPILARLNLNLVSEFLITNHFFERYRSYSPEATRILGGGAGPKADALEEMIASMAEREGHYMAVKFCDLVVRTVDRNLFRTLRSVELALVEMRNSDPDDEAANQEHAERIAGELRSRIGDDAAEMFFRRIRAAAPRASRFDEKAPFPGESETPAPEDPPLTQGNDGATPEHRGPGGGGRMHAYADVLRRSALDGIDESDGAGIRRLIHAIFRKNERRFGKTEATAITLGVLRIWERDLSIEVPKRRLVDELIEEWSKGDDDDVIAGADDGAGDMEMAMGGGHAPVDGHVESSEEVAQEELQDGPFLIDELREREEREDPGIAVDTDIDDSFLIDGDGEIEAPADMESGDIGSGSHFQQEEADDEALGPGVIRDVDMAAVDPEPDATFVVRNELLFEDTSLDTAGNREALRRRGEPDPEGVEQ